ncbi:hypothetical protein [Natrinema sp. SYSU A 869]|uniref:hypothetical protein n=1 Tax=Natrinema sp. SYSU A 869 TaxID=2871694 RepID=UPI001CA42B50|nr:hypothetical protein [Natrinema sp. SYSU A 869]
MTRRGGYMRNATDTIERDCDHCEWHAVAGSYPDLIEQYQDHLRDEHPTVWLRS